MRYHWICTAMGSSARMVTARTLDGVVDTAPGTTRQDIYQEVIDAVRRDLGLDVGDHLVILHFDLAPNDIPSP